MPRMIDERTVKRIHLYAFLAPGTAVTIDSSKITDRGDKAAMNQLRQWMLRYHRDRHYVMRNDAPGKITITRREARYVESREDQTANEWAAFEARYRARWEYGDK
jgi:hypothetical protein